MRHELVRSICLVAFCVVLTACQSTAGGTRVTDTKSEKRQDAAQIRVELGQRYMQQGKLEIALDNLQKALQYDENYVDAHTVIAVLYERIGNVEEAGKHYKRAVELAPKSGDTNNNYGQFLCARGQYDEAQKYYAQAMRDPFYKTPAVLYANAGVCLVDHGGGTRLDEAETDFRRALEADSHNALALYYMARILYGKDDFFHARAFIQRFEALGHPDPAALLLARNIEVKLGHADAARSYADRLRKDFPDSEQTRSLDAVAPRSQ
ncbi:MAG: type IV pilus biogenesis/stability protein PilW [Proteobacteria bacterium]|nr:type IV pilus biogenesis/stability protein PilW [Pseudomonadota bacterium]